VNEWKRETRAGGAGGDEVEEGEEDGGREVRKQNERHRESSLAMRANWRQVGAILHTSWHERNEKT
jgi:hypothetical protein